MRCVRRPSNAFRPACPAGPASAVPDSRASSALAWDTWPAEKACGMTTYPSRVTWSMSFWMSRVSSACAISFFFSSSGFSILHIICSSLALLCPSNPVFIDVGIATGCGVEPLEPRHVSTRIGPIGSRQKVNLQFDTIPLDCRHIVLSLDRLSNADRGCQRRLAAATANLHNHNIVHCEPSHTYITLSTQAHVYYPVISTHH